MLLRKTHGVARPEDVEIVVNGRPLRACPGESIATALLGAGIRSFRRSPRGNCPRGPFCLMGSCQECVVCVDGRRVPACQTLVRAGLNVTIEDESGT
jgi:predicted molibdopterin-dependent oxidoreductase YjgC